MRRIVAMVAVLMGVNGFGGIGMAREARMAAGGHLEAITRADMERATVVGTGCTWAAASDGRMRFAATDDVAVGRRASGAVRLRPHPMAKEMFPFTFDRWVARGIEVEVIPTGRTKVIWTELLKTPAALKVTIGGRAVQTAGILSCGS